MDHPGKKEPNGHCSSSVKHLFNVFIRSSTYKKESHENSEVEDMGRGRKTLKISSSQDFQRVQKIRVFLVGQVRGVFSFFTVTECIALLIEACQYKINTSCSSLIIVLLPDFCIAKTKDDSPSSSEVSPVIDSTNSRSRTSKFPQEGKLTLYCFYFWLTVIWSRQHQGTHHLMCAKYSSLQPEKSGN